MARSARDLYYVAVKGFLERNGKLFVFRDRYGDWDLPGGRIQRHEFRTPLERVLERKIREELGRGVRYRLGKPAVFMRHERREVSRHGQRIRIFAIGYRAAFHGGEIKLSPQHTEYRWVSLERFSPRNYFKGGWLAGVQEYLRARKRS